MSEGGIGVDWGRTGDRWGVTVRGVPVWVVLVAIGVLLLVVFGIGARIGHRLGRARRSPDAPLGQPRAPARSAASAKSGS